MLPHLKTIKSSRERQRVVRESVDSLALAATK